jgi:hypothetical protein
MLAVPSSPLPFKLSAKAAVCPDHLDLQDPVESLANPVDLVLQVCLVCPEIHLKLLVNL